ncbi:MAG: YciI family protein [bacterium]
MKFVVTFEDNEEMAHMRQAHMTEHLSFLEANRLSVDAAGPLFHYGNNEPAGGIWIVDDDDENAVHKLVKSDPFWPTGLRKNYTVLGWKQVFSDGKRLINPARFTS